MHFLKTLSAYKDRRQMQSTITLMGLKLISASVVLVQRDACGCCPSLNHSRQIDWPLCDQEGLII